MLVNNAGWDVFKLFTKTKPSQWDKLIAIAIAIAGALHMHHAVLPGMAVYAACEGAAWCPSPKIAMAAKR